MQRKSTFTHWSVALACCLLAGGCARDGQTVVKKTDPKLIDGKIVEEEVEFAGPRPDKPTPKMCSDFGHVYLEAGNDMRAEELFRRSLELDKRHIPGYIGVARVYRKRKLYDEALTSLEEGLKKTHKAPAIYNEMALVHAETEHYGPAIDAMQNAIDAEPENKLYRLNLAGMLAVIGRYDESFQEYIKVISPADARYRIAGVLFSQGDREGSLAQLRLAQRQDPSHEGVAQMLGELTRSPVQPAGYVGQPAGHGVRHADFAAPREPSAGAPVSQSDVLPAPFRPE